MNERASIALTTRPTIPIFASGNLDVVYVVRNSRIFYPKSAWLFSDDTNAAHLEAEIRFPVNVKNYMYRL